MVEGGPQARRHASLLREAAASTARATAGGDRPARGRARLQRRRASRLRAAEAPRRRPQPRRDLRAAEAEGAAEGSEDGQLADVRAQPGPHPLPAGEGGSSPLSATLALHGAAAARVPADLRRRQALPRQQQRLRLRARRGHRQGPLGTADRQLNASSPAYYRHRLYIVNLVPGHIVKLDAKTGRMIWKNRCPGGPSPRRW